MQVQPRRVSHIESSSFTQFFKFLAEIGSGMDFWQENVCLVSGASNDMVFSQKPGILESVACVSCILL